MAFGHIRSYLKCTDSSARTIVIGDIHGCFDELQELLCAVGFSPSDQLVSVGDLVDRGPDSWKVAKFFRDLPNAYSVLGNHERRLAGTILGTSRPAWSQLQTLSRLAESKWSQWAQYFESLPAVIETQHVIATHAQLDPAVSLSEQDAFFTCAVGGTRTVIERDEKGIPLWFHGMSLEKPICVGHISYDRVELVTGKLYGLDTEAVYGGRLTALVLPDYQIVSVKASRDYYAHSRGQWLQQDSSGNKRLDEWRMRLSLRKCDIVDWPLQTLAAVLRLQEPVDDKALSDAIHYIKSVIAARNVENLIQRAKMLLEHRFGRIPEAGRERGDYVQRLKAFIQDPQFTRVALGLLERADDTVVGLSKAIPKKTLREAEHMLHALTEAVGCHLRATK